jgi:hypothetical protein
MAFNRFHYARSRRREAYVSVLQAAAELRDIAGFAIGVLAEQPDPYASDGAWASLEKRWEAGSDEFERMARSDLSL